ncbi:MAG: hypothetical protein L6R35_004741 [Caloplaca aegaea]|nr:MAG: hypothetical protein L6R35_004741 [Caloplaca aegaea]
MTNSKVNVMEDQGEAADIARWRDDVARAVQPFTAVKQKPSHQRPTRPALAAASGNPQRYDFRCNSKAPLTYNYTRNKKMTSDDNYDLKAPPEKRGRSANRGSNRKGKQPAKGKSIPLNDKAGSPSKQSVVQSSPQKGTSTTTRSRSQASRTFESPLAPRNVDMTYLASCSPYVKRTDPKVVDLSKIPAEIMDLYLIIHRMPHVVIPEALKQQYRQQPSALTQGLSDQNFLPVKDTPYRPDKLAYLKTLVDQIVREARFNTHMNAIEKQWGGTVFSWLSGYLMSWPFEQSFRLLNVEQCSIAPNDLHTKMPNGTALPYETLPGTITKEIDCASTDGKKAGKAKDVTRMIDWSLALILSQDDENMLEKAFETINPNECSVNQSLSYIKHSPIFLDVELKKSQPGSNPEVALAIWASGALQKKIRHDWDTSLPMPAIAIEGNTWSAYMFVPWIDRYNMRGLRMWGPFPMGSTTTLLGTWQIVFQLNALIEWGTTTYSKHFQKTVMEGWAQERIPDIEGYSGISRYDIRDLSVN